jgi:hypothetical protein
MARRGRSIPLAWAGWSTRVPPDWRPLSVTGTWRRGAMMLGDAARALVQVKWWRPGSRRFDPERWIRRRVRKAAGRMAKPQPPQDAPRDFPVAGCAAHEAAGGGRRLWYGYAPEANLAIEFVIDRDIPVRHRKSIDGRVLPLLAAAPAGEGTRWAVLDVSFGAPAGFVYRAARLHLGDVALCFAAGGGRRLLLRQVYPSGLALSRRELGKWLAHPPFREHRRPRPAGECEEWTAESFGRRLAGVIRGGRKALPWPLGFVAPRRTVAAAVEDPDLERLLIVEYDAPDDAPSRLAAEAVAAMNWARLGPEDRA